MSDFSNMMIAGIDDAAAEYATEDFADAYGRGVVGRVRRRRAVHAVGVGGGTMLAAGALAVGAGQVTGSRTVEPAGGGQCVTPTPSIGEAQEFEMRTAAGAWTLTNVTTGELVVSVQLQADGSWLATQASGATDVVDVSENGTIVVDTESGGILTLRLGEDNVIEQGEMMAPPGAGDATWGPPTVTSGYCVTPAP